MQFKGLGFPNKHFATQNRRLYRQTHCLRPLWSLLVCFQTLKIIFQARPSALKFNLKRTVVFCAKFFEVGTRSKQCELVPTHNFWIWFYQSNFKNTCWASPKPDVPHKNCAGCASWRTLNKQIFREKFVQEKSALIHTISHQTGTITSGFEGQKRK